MTGRRWLEAIATSRCARPCRRTSRGRRGPAGRRRCRRRPGTSRRRSRRPGEASVEGERLGQRLAHALDRVVHGARAPAEVGQHDDELVAAEARHEVALAHAAPQPPRDLAQRRVARRVPVRVVDRLEAVEVEHHDPDRARPRAGPRQRRLERALQRAPVGEPRQRVVVGLVAGPAVLLDPGRHVVVGRDRAVLLAGVVVERVRVDLDPQQRAVPADEAHDVAGDLLALQRARQRQPVVGQEVAASSRRSTGTALSGRSASSSTGTPKSSPPPRWRRRCARPCPRPRRPPAAPRGSRG